MKNTFNSWIRWIMLVIICSNGISYGINRYVLVPIQDQLMNIYDINDVQYNLLMTLYSWPNIIFSLICGILVDKFGVRKVLILSWILIYIGLFFILYSCIAENYFLLCIGRTILGVGNEGMSITIKLYGICFFKPSEWGIVFGVYLAFVVFGVGTNTFLSYRVYVWLGLIYSMSIPLFLTPFVSIPLFILMFIETKYQSTHKNANEHKELIESTKENEETKFKLSDIKQLSVYYWILAIGFVIYTAALQSHLNIQISFIHHMFSYSYELATTIAGLYANIIALFSNLLSGVLATKVGKMELLIFANICAIFGYIIYGWINNHIFWAYFGITLQNIASGFSYPPMWAAIPLLVGDKLKGTGYGFATSIRFATIAISYVIAGILTNPDDGKKKYIDVQLYIVILVAISTIIYIVSYYLDIKYNNSILKNVNHKHQSIDTEISLQKTSDILTKC